MRMTRSSRATFRSHLLCDGRHEARFGGCAPWLKVGRLGRAVDMVVVDATHPSATLPSGAIGPNNSSGVSAKVSHARPPARDINRAITVIRSIYTLSEEAAAFGQDRGRRRQARAPAGVDRGHNGDAPLAEG